MRMVLMDDRSLGRATGLVDDNNGEQVLALVDAQLKDLSYEVVRVNAGSGDLVWWIERATKKSQGHVRVWH